MSDNPQPLLPAEPFWKSPVFTKLVGAGVAQLISLGLRVAKMLGHHPMPDMDLEEIKAIGADAAQLIAFGLTAWAMINRKNSAVHPLTFTETGAAKQNAINPPMLSEDPTKATVPQQTATMSNTPPRDAQ
jgi:hypothetical protein